MPLKKILIDCSSLNERPLAVFGGPCICFAKGDPERLTLQDLIDSLIPCIIAAAHGTPAHLYFQDFESNLMSEVLKYDKKSADFLTMSRYLLSGIEAILSCLGHSVPHIQILRTSDKLVKKIIDTTVSKMKSVINDEDLYGLYSTSGEDYPRNRPEEKIMLEVYLRNLSLYHIDFTSNFIEASAESIAIIENSTQKKAVHLVKEKFNKTIKHIEYSPTPNRQGKEMCTGNRNHKIELRSTSQQILDRSKLLEQKYKDYFSPIFCDLSIPEVMSVWKKSVAL